MSDRSPLAGSAARYANGQHARIRGGSRGSPSRRMFLGGSLTAAATAGLPGGGLFASGMQRVRVGLVGCGGRGTGAALQAAAADPAVRIVAMGDLFADHVASSAGLLEAGIGTQFDCPAARRFVGQRAFLEVIGSGVDMVLLASPPCARPEHLEAAIAAGKHVYCEKPVAIDVAGVVRAAAAAAAGKAAGLSLVSGFCSRRDPAMQEAVARIHAGEIGRPLSLQMHAATGLPWLKPAGAGESEWAWQQRNWISFSRLSGGHFVERHVEAIDRALWVLGDVAPLSAAPLRHEAPAPGCGIGDCQRTTAASYRFADGATLEASLERSAAVASRCEETVIASRGTGDLTRAVVGGIKASTLPARPGRYQAAMTSLVQGLLAGHAVYDGREMCLGTLVAVMGRMAAETGRTVFWDELFAVAAPVRPV